MQTTQQIIEALDARIAEAKDELIEAMRAEAKIAALRADIARLEAAKKALDAKQTPEGRRRIGEAAKKRGKKQDAAPAVQAEPQCAECHGAGTMGTGTEQCPFADCGAYVCGACWTSHDARRHFGDGAHDAAITQAEATHA